MARSATPLNWWTCGGLVVCSTLVSSISSANSRETSSPALSVCRAPTMRVRVRELALTLALNAATNRRTSWAPPACASCGR
eukprot:6105034-Prymnesium_polylepis.1